MTFAKIFKRYSYDPKEAINMVSSAVVKSVIKEREKVDQEGEVYARHENGSVSCKETVYFGNDTILVIYFTITCNGKVENLSKHWL